MDQLTHLSPNEALRLRNINCPYCNAPFGEGAPFDKEHAVGRRFVPRGSLDGCWNLILRSCRACNAAKAALEDDISAITMQPNVAGQFASDDRRLREEALRKGRSSYSRKTHKRVAESKQNLVVNCDLGGAVFTFTFVAPPQVDEDRLFELARLQLQAFFFFITYDHETHRGHFWLGGFYPLFVAPKGNWGDPRLRWFEETTRDWDPKWFSITADGFFRSWIKRPMDDRPFWAWALEWNSNYRLVGFFGEREYAEAISGDIPKVEFQYLSHTENRFMRFRRDTRLDEAQDHLFELPESMLVAAE